MSKIEMIKQYYEPNLGKGLPDFKVLGWESREAQYMRFEMFGKNIEIENKKLLDVGCGLGNLIEYLSEKGVSFDYTGVDISQKMIDYAKKRNPTFRFLCLDIFNDNTFSPHDFDIVYTSGIFNLNLGNNNEFVEIALKRLFYLARSVVAFNLLHHKSPDKDDRYFYFSPEEIVETIKHFKCDLSDIQVIEGYLKNDFMIICKK
ncbi:class I SAM-dependent methyltransferase [Pseudobacteroides cellulosolvens]|uniref:Methyltransferase domain-containing protein n=1 Tax=Pseudobacteroides cellulosolvens ATCC 35603 = DSM 2933 TaxID=398512 RepID=A0A0L6JW17_9FIRM|nr:class I SAM-dependent methyltransferase [Pseudobacteroides cellulosolvens]KNY29627.1 hypothetical protein Bccel_4901 [Pseudobacteroides cellulosolvens ATCC 35603 = DSM 2933]